MNSGMAQGGKTIVDALMDSLAAALRVPEVGDRVKTSNGYGTIVSIESDQCLIALEGQEARMWERISTLSSQNR